MPNPQILNDQLTLNQLGGQIVSTTLLLDPPGFSDLPTALTANQRGVLQSTAASDYNFHLIEWSLIALSYIYVIVCL